MCYLFTDNELRILLIGKTGHGKSTAGNALLKTDAFRTSHFSGSETTKSQYASSTHKTKRIVVVDTPGMFDTRHVDSEAINEKSRMEIMRACYLLSPGFHAAVIAVNAAEKFTKENQETINIYHNLFGDDFWNYTFLLLTHWDLMEAKKVKFEEYLENANDDFKAVLCLCEGKCYPIGQKKTKQQAKTVIDGIKANMERFGGGCFSDVLFNQLEMLHSIWKQDKFHRVFEISAERLRTESLTSLNETSRKLTIEDALKLLTSEIEDLSSDELREGEQNDKEERRAKVSAEGEGRAFDYLVYLVKVVWGNFSSLFESLYKREIPSDT